MDDTALAPELSPSPVVTEKQPDEAVAQPVAEVSPWAVEPGIPDDAYVKPSYAWCTGRAYAYVPSHDLLPVRVLVSDSTGYYAVTRGRMVGVFLDVNLATEMVHGISNYANKRYAKQGDALAAFNRLRREGRVAISYPRESRPQLILAAQWGHIVALILAGLFGFGVALFRDSKCDSV